jgi:hypothetical protein
VSSLLSPDIIVELERNERFHLPAVADLLPKAKIDQHDETGSVPAMHMIPAHAKEYAQKAPIPIHKSTELPPTLRESASSS